MDCAFNAPTYYRVDLFSVSLMKKYPKATADIVNNNNILNIEQLI